MARIIPLNPSKGLWALESRYDPRLVEACKRVPGLAWDKEKRVWWGYLDALAVLAGMHKGIDASAAQGLLGPQYEWASWAPLRLYQRQAADFLLTHGQAGCLLADDMGLGKTCTTLAAASKVGRLVVVCPSYVRGVWASELGKWDTGRTPFFPQGVKNLGEIDSAADTVVIHYDILHAWADKLVAWAPDAVCFDEAHLLQSEKSLRAVAARKVAGACRMRWGLTGTPLTNRPKDLWNTVDVLSPGRLGNFFAYGKRYCGAHQEAVTPEKVVWKFDGKSNLEELSHRTKYFMLRRTKKDVGLQLPPKTRQVVYVDVGRKKYITEASGDAAIRRALDASADAKLPAAWEMVSSHLEAGAKVVCFTWRRAVAEKMADDARLAGYAAECITGGISAARKGAAIERVRGTEGGVLLACTIDSSSTGVDFTFATVCVFAELDWKPHALLQAEARLHRFGQGDPVLIQYILGKGTIDEVIASAVINKLDTFEAVVGGGETLGAELRGNEADIMSEMMAAIESGKLGQDD